MFFSVERVLLMRAPQPNKFSFKYALPIFTVKFDSIPGTFPMFIDTGASHTLLPMEWLEILGHSNKKIKHSMISGVGKNKNKTYSHKIEIKILNDSDNDKVIYKTDKMAINFCDGLSTKDFPYGLIGRDIICEKWLHYEQNTASKNPSEWYFTFMT